MLEMDHEKEKFEAKLQKALDERSAYIEKALNYEELLDVYGDKENIDFDELEWDDGDIRSIELLENSIWIYERILSTIDDHQNAGDDKKAIHRNNKNAETLVTSIRGIKHESETVIQQEQEMIKEANEALEFLSFIRGK